MSKRCSVPQYGLKVAKTTSVLRSDLKEGSTRLSSSRSLKSFAEDLSTRPTTYDVVRCCRYTRDWQQSQRCRLIRCLFTLHQDTKQHRTNPDLFFFLCPSTIKITKITASKHLSHFPSLSTSYELSPIGVGFLDWFSRFSHLSHLYSIYASRQSFPEALATSATCVEQGCQGVAGEEAVHISGASFVVVTSKDNRNSEPKAFCFFSDCAKNQKTAVQGTSWRRGTG